MRRAVGTVLLLLLLGSAVGCRGASRGPGVASGGDAGGASASARPSGAADNEERRRQFAECMRDHGLEIDDPDPNGGAVRVQASAGAQESAKGKDAMRACQQYLPAGKLTNTDPQQMEQLRRFAACMREHGIEMSDPDPNSGGALQLPKGDGAGKFNPDGPAFQRAEQACKDTLPGRKGGK